MSPMPGKVMPESTLKPSRQGRLSTKMRPPLTRQAFLRGVPHWSMVKLLMFSKTAMTVDSAAKLMNRKNSVHHSWPKGIMSKTAGRVMKTRLGPAPGSTPKAKQLGKMIRPAMRATRVSMPAMRTDSPGRLCFLSMKLPKMAMEPMPTLMVKKAWPMAAKTASQAPSRPLPKILEKSGTR